MSRPVGRPQLWTPGEELGCRTGKVAFRSRKAAAVTSRRLRDRLGHMRPYCCQHCGWWHIGHMPQPVMAGRVGADKFYGRA